MEIIIQIITSPVTNVVLTLLLIFQWLRQYAKEQSIKNSLFSIRRMIDRSSNPAVAQNMAQKADDLIDVVDATLATLDARMPFAEKLKETLNATRDRFHQGSLTELKRLPNESKSSTEQ